MILFGSTMDAASGIEKIRKNRTILLSLSAIVIVVAIGLLLNRDDLETPAMLGATTTTTAVTGTTTESPDSTDASQPDSEVPPVDCLDLLDSREVSEALGVPDNPNLDGGSSGLSKGEVCTETLDADERFFVQISPSGPSDFGAGASLIGVTADEVGGVGDQAIWFGGSDSDNGGASGVLAVRKETQHGSLYVRVFLGRPDVDEATQRRIAIGLAILALPRFPGVEFVPPPRPEPELVTFDEAPTPDISSLSLADNLLAKEGTGEWSRGDGLVATLGLISGEVEAAEVLDSAELVDQSATLVIQLAREYLGASEEGPARLEIERLLDQITLDQEEFDQLDFDPGESLVLEPAFVTASAVTPAQGEADDPCEGVAGEDLCLEPVPLSDRFGVSPGKYRLYADPSDDSGWTDDYVDAAKTAILDSAARYEPLGQMPATTVVLQAGGPRLFVDSGATDCVVYIYEGLTSLIEPGGEFLQLIAREMAFCFIGSEFQQLISADPANTRWWTRGLVNYLSGYVFPSANAEHVKLPQELAGKELSTTLADRSWTNWAFFEHLHSSLGVEGNLATITGFPVGGDHLDALAAFSDIPELFHDFERALTDADIDDLGPGTVPFEPRTWELPVFSPLESTIQIPRFGVRRIHITVPSGLYACIESVETGDQNASWREGTPAERGRWGDEAPTVIEGETMLVVTAVKPGAEFTLAVTQVSEEPDCSEEDVPPTTTLGECGTCPPSDFYYNG